MKIVAVIGSSGSGKTTAAAELRKHYQSKGLRVCVISGDNFYNALSPELTREEKDRINFDHPDSIDFALFKQMVEALRRNESVEIPTYDFVTSSRKEEVIPISPSDYDLIIFEGILLTHTPQLTALFSAIVFVNTDLELCLRRRAERDMVERGRTREQVHAQWHETVLPMYHQFVAPCIERAHIVAENNETFSTGENRLQFNLGTISRYLDAQLCFDSTR